MPGGVWHVLDVLRAHRPAHHLPRHLADEVVVGRELAADDRDAEPEAGVDRDHARVAADGVAREEHARDLGVDHRLDGHAHRRLRRSRRRAPRGSRSRAASTGSPSSREPRRRPAPRPAPRGSSPAVPRGSPRRCPRRARSSGRRAEDARCRPPPRAPRSGARSPRAPHRAAARSASPRRSSSRPRRWPRRRPGAMRDDVSRSSPSRPVAATNSRNAVRPRSRSRRARGCRRRAARRGSRSCRRTRPRPTPAAPRASGCGSRSLSVEDRHHAGRAVDADPLPGRDLRRRAPGADHGG